MFHNDGSIKKVHHRILNSSSKSGASSKSDKSVRKLRIQGPIPAGWILHSWSLNLLLAAKSINSPAANQSVSGTRAAQHLGQIMVQPFGHEANLLHLSWCPDTCCQLPTYWAWYVFPVSAVSLRSLWTLKTHIHTHTSNFKIQSMELLLLSNSDRPQRGQLNMEGVSCSSTENIICPRACLVFEKELLSEMFTNPVFFKAPHSPDN